MSRCSVWSRNDRQQLDALLASGSNVRSVSQMFAVPRSTLARHSQHAREIPHRFALIRSQDDPLGQGDPLSEAIALAARARTPREKLRGLEQVRAAPKLRMRGVELDPEDRAAAEDPRDRRRRRVSRDDREHPGDGRARGPRAVPSGETVLRREGIDPD